MPTSVAPVERRVPVVLLTGFLGSGKTTLLGNVLRLPSMQGSAVIINEAGEIGLDHELVENVSEEIELLESGCLCCAVRGDLVRTLRNLFMRGLRRDLGGLKRVIIETSGLADPAPIIHTLSADFFLAERFVLEGVVCTLDVRNAAWQISQHEEARHQLILADRILLTKCDLAMDAQIEEIQQSASVLNESAQLVRSDATDAHAALFEHLAPYRGDVRSEVAKAWLGEVREAALRKQVARNVFGQTAPQWPPIHAGRISTYALRFDEPFEWPAFARAIDTLLSVLGSAILRVKGLVAVRGEDLPHVVHAIRHERYPDRCLAAWPDEDHSTRLIFIVDDLPRTVIDSAFSAFTAGPKGTGSRA